jgi:hypothetical protein
MIRFIPEGYQPQQSDVLQIPPQNGTVSGVVRIEDAYVARRAAKMQANAVRSVDPEQPTIAQELGFVGAQLRKHAAQRITSSGIPDASTGFLRGVADYLDALASRLEAGQ